MPPKLGIVAGGGTLPSRVYAACRAQGREALVVALRGHAEARTFAAGTPLTWVDLGEAGSSFNLLRKQGVGEIVLVGPVKRPSLFSLIPDARTAMFIARVGLRALGDDGLLRAIIAEFEAEGFKVIGVDSILGDLVAQEGVWGRHKPDARAEADIALGLRAAKAHGAADRGQAVVVQQGAVIDRETEAGTDALIRHAGRLKKAGPGPILVKTAKPGQERRADLPTVGVHTVTTAVAAGFAGIAVEAGGTLVPDREAAIAAADAAGLFLVGVKAP